MEVESWNLVTENHEQTDQASNVQVLYDQKSHENAPSDEAMEKNSNVSHALFSFYGKPRGINIGTKGVEHNNTVKVGGI